MDQIAKGHRSLVYLTTFKGKKAIKKTERKDTQAINRIQNEIFWLKKLNKSKIGPKLYAFKDDYFICEYISGKRIIDFFENYENLKKVIILILKQCRILDKLRVDKKEMSNPYKHIIVNRNKPVMIDFERAKISLKPQNVTAFFHFLTSKKIASILERKNIKIDKERIKELSKKYKRSYSDKDFKQLIKEIN